MTKRWPTEWVDIPGLEIRLVDHDFGDRPRYTMEVGTRYTAEIDHDGALPGITVTIEAEVYRGNAHAVAVTLRAAPSAPPISGTHLRAIPLALWLEQTHQLDVLFQTAPDLAEVRAAHQAGTWRGKPLVASRGISAKDLDQALTDALTAGKISSPPAATGAEVAGRARKPRSETLPLVVEEYRKALDDPDPAVRKAPTQAVADRLGFQRGHVSRLLSAARKEGLLGAASRGVAGEAAEGEEQS